MKNQTLRIASIDIFRALTMLLMIFVNDIPGLGDTIPHWLHHAAKDEDMLGLSDVVFPCFLFCVGLSIPFAVKNRTDKGDSKLQIFTHIAQRTIALLVMGLFSMNNFTATANSIGIAPQWLKLLSTVAFFMIWNLYPQAERRAKKIFSTLQTFGWIILATIALIFIGKPASAETQLFSGFISAGFPSGAQYIFQYSIIAVCALIPTVTGFLRSRNLLKLIANAIIVIIIFYLFLFKGANADGFVGLRPGWWQILGLIGWTYFYTSVIFIFTKNKFLPNIIAWIFFTFLCIAANTGLAADIGISGFIPGNGSFQSLAFAGIIASLLMQNSRGRQNFGKLCSTYIAVATLMFAAATVAHKYFIISKLHETCTWIFYCIAISFALLIFIYWLTDIKNKKSWFDIIKPAGTSTLTCYLIPSVWYGIVSLAAITYPEFTRSGCGGLIKSLIFAFAVTGITWTLGKLKIKLKI
jgi:predicted acyltransferase